MFKLYLYFPTASNRETRYGARIHSDKTQRQDKTIPFFKSRSKSKVEFMSAVLVKHDTNSRPFNVSLLLPCSTKKNVL